MISTPVFGPDNSYEARIRQSSNILPVYCSAPVNRNYNPSQASYYMIDGARDWLAWYKKQTGVDGIVGMRVKHFPYPHNRILSAI